MIRRRTHPLAVGLLLPVLAVAGCGAQPGAQDASSFSAPSESTGSAPTGSTTTATDSTTTTAPPASASGRASTSPTTRPADLPCSAADMEILIEDVVGGADAQATTRRLSITNKGAECTLSGFPIVTYQASEGEIIGAPAGQVGEPAAEFSLDSGATATAAVREQEAGKYGPDCQPTQAHLMAVALRHDGETAYVKRERTACAATGIQLMEVGPYEEGDGTAG
jgi:hypothetical protein